MSEFDKARKEAKADAKEMDKLLNNYSYKGSKEAARTDVEFRKLLAEHFGKARDDIVAVLEMAYQDSEMETASKLEGVLEWLNVAMLEMRLELEWSDETDHEHLIRLVKLDRSLARNAEKLLEATGRLKDMTGQNRRMLAKRCHETTELITGMLEDYKKRRHVLGGP
jgi:hypothetical protein